MLEAFASGVAIALVAVAVILYGLPAILLSDGFCKIMQDRADRAVREARAAAAARQAMLEARRAAVTAAAEDREAYNRTRVRAGVSSWITMGS